MVSRPPLSAEQAEIKTACVEAARGGHKVCCFDGPGGTGKTFLAAEVAFDLLEQGFNVVPCGPTGRSTSRLDDSLRRYGLDLEVRTLSDICERTMDGEDGRPVFLGKMANLPDNSVLLCDEFSMVGERYLRTKLLPAIPESTLIGFGDQFQLPPVMDSDNPYLMRTPYKLEHVHRQAEGSGILDLARAFRKDRVRVFEKPQDGPDAAPMVFDYQRADLNVIPVVSLQRSITSIWTTLKAVDAPVLVGTNELRGELNQLARLRFGVSGPPQAGETIRVERNNPEMRLFNGDQVRIAEVLSERTSDGETASRVRLEGDLQVWLPHDPQGEIWVNEPDAIVWDWGYATTIHKSQGAEWKHVRVAVCQSLASKSRSLHGRRTLYTAVTRARETLDVFVVDYAYNRARARVVRNARAAARSRQRPRVRKRNQRDRRLAKRLKDL